METAGKSSAHVCEEAEASAYSLVFLFVSSFIHHKVLFGVCLCFGGIVLQHLQTI